MTGVARVAMGSWAGFLAVWSAGLLRQDAWATELWVWPQAPFLNHVFVASILAAMAAPIGWIAWTGQVAAAAGGALNLLVTSLGGAWVLYNDPGFADNQRVQVYAGLFGANALLSLSLFLWSRRFPLMGGPRSPGLVRVAFVLFVAMLLIVGTALVRGEPHIFPWPLKPAPSALYGFIYLGAALYFLYGVARPSWRNACGQLLGFLAYDLVLLPYYVPHLSRVEPAHRLSLQVYLAVLGSSAAIALWYLLVDKRTRLIGDSPDVVQT